MDRPLCRVVVYALLALSLWACGDEASAPGVEAIYGVAAETSLTPFPSNRYTVADAATATGLRLDITRQSSADFLIQSGLDETLDELNELDGFSVNGGVMVSFSGPIDSAGLDQHLPDENVSLAAERPPEAYLQADAPFVLIDVDPASPEQGRMIPLLGSWWEQPKDGYYVEDEFTLIAQPAVPLLPQTRYLFAVTDAQRARDGGPVTRSTRFEALLRGEADGDYGAEVRAGLLVLAEAAGIETERVALATSFTTTTVHDELFAGADKARQAPAPVLLEDWTVETPLQPDGRVRFRAVFDTAEYRSPAPDERWKIGADGAPLVQQQVGLEVFAAISDAATSQPRTVVIYGHGLGGDKDGCWGTAQRLADLNVAVFSIDSPHHGSRSADASPITSVFSFFGINADDQSFVVGKARDNFRQMALDQLELVRLIDSLSSLDILPPGAPDGIPDLDTSTIVYIGHSFGSVQGPTIFALAPEIQHAVWNVGGGNMTTLLRESATFGLLLNTLRPAGYSDGAVARFLALIQGIIDPGDSVNYAAFGTQATAFGLPGAPRNVLLQEVVADTIVPNASSRALARAAGLPVLDALDPVPGVISLMAPLSGNLPTGKTGAMTQFNVVHGDEPATHGELIFAPEGQAQYLEFLRSALQDNQAVINPSY